MVARVDVRVRVRVRDYVHDHVLVHERPRTKGAVEASRSPNYRYYQVAGLRKD